MANPVIKFNGMNNRARPEELPLNMMAHAVNVMFSDTGELIIPGQEFNEFYEGTVHSVNASANGVLFAEDGTLYKYADTPDSLLASVGSNAFSYTRPIGTAIYFSNGTVRGKYIKGESATREWGTAIPTAEPTVTSTTTGGMFAGTYRVVTTWIADEESGASNSVEVEVSEGGGIQLTSFPGTVPDYVTKIAIWCTHANGKDLYLYSEVDDETTSVTLTKFIGSIPLDTQFGIPPAPAVNAPIIDHYGRIYWGDGSLLRFTHIGRFGPCYGLTMPFAYHTFDSEIQTIVSTPGALYVGTLYRLYKVFNIDGDGPAIIEPLQDCASVKGSECYDPDGVSAYFMSHRGFIKATPEGLQELSYANAAIPLYTSGSMTVTEYDGLKYLMFFGSSGASNPLANVDWISGETFPQSSGWAINLTTGAVSKYENSGFNRVHNGYSSSSSGLGAIGAGASLVGIATTGNYDFGSTYQKRIYDAYLEIEGDKLKLTAITDNGSVNYQTAAKVGRKTDKVDMAKGSKGRYWQFKFTNIAGLSTVVSELEPIITETSRRK